MLTMLTTDSTAASSTRGLHGPHNVSTARAAQKVVIVNGGTQILELLETVLDAGSYDVVFVESSANAYSEIKRVQPNLVMLCIRIEDVHGFQLLSMLKMDEETRAIPVLTYTTEYEGQDTEDEEEESPEGEIQTPRLALRMN